MSLFAPLLLVMSVALMVLSVSMLAVAGLASTLITGQPGVFVKAALVCLGAALIVGALGRVWRTPHLFTRQMFLITGGTWLLLPLFGSLPLLLAPEDISFTDAVFEAVSGLTTTGSTVLSGLEGSLQDILLWRSILQWLGGIGVICMAVAILPFLKVGGMRLFKTESSLFTDDNVPRAQQLVKSILWVYIALSGVCAVAYRLTGMSTFDAINLAMCTVSTGGYATTDASFGGQSLSAHWVGIVFMLAGAIPFIGYVQSLRERRWQSLLTSQVIVLLGIVLAVSGVLALELFRRTDTGPMVALTLSLFNATSIVTTTGFASGDYTLWGPLTVAVMFFITYLGGCSGSTSGGTKIFRIQILLVLLRDHLRRAVHPRLTWNRSYNGQSLGDEVVTAVAAYFLVLALSQGALTVGLAAFGLDLTTSITGAATALMNVGPGLGDVIGPAGNFQSLPDGAKWLLSAGMLMGRLEFLTILTLLTPTFWRG